VKLGDLVTMPGSWIRNMDAGDSLGIVVELPFVGDDGQMQQTPRVAVLWAGSRTVGWEPMCWLEVISEAR